MRGTKIINISGIDGSGKTTIVNWLSERLQDAGYDVEVKWLRFNHVLTKPLLALCRLLGLTKYENIDGIRMGYHDFHRSRVISWLFVYLQYLDALRVYFIHVAPALRKKNKVLILDRFIHDILIDIMIDTRIQDLDRKWAGRAFLRLIPADTLVIPVLRRREQVLDARPESRIDKNFEARFALYEGIPGRHDCRPVYNNGSLQETLDAVGSIVGVQA